MMPDSIQILHNDGHCVVCIKPAGVLSEQAAAPNMVDILQQVLGCTVYPVHRLDRAVGGVMVYALAREAAANLSRQVAERSMQKSYLAVVHGCPEQPRGRLTDYLFKDSRSNKSFVVKTLRKGAKEASLDYEVLQSAEADGQRYSLVAVNLITGRSHQIRVQFSYRKMPLVGDGRYGSRCRECGIALWSHVVAFTDMNGERLTFSAAPDCNVFPFGLFSL